MEFAETTAKGRRRVEHADARLRAALALPRRTLEPNAEYYVSVRANASPKNCHVRLALAGDDAVGFAKFTFIR
jgi:hypothetical protein